jgi:NADPH:quinone reductase-like Zn-dependent oxidoreductase
VPAIGDGGVLVRVHATSVNPVDCYVRRGGLKRYAGVQFPIVPGVDLSGVVEKTGPNVREFRAGDAVFAFIPRVGGACAEFAACDARWLGKKPAGLSHWEAGVLPCVGLTALQALRDKARLKAGQSVLIVGASGGVGTMAVQIARTMGVEVVAVCSTANVDFVRSLGATRVIDYLKQDVLMEAQRFDAVFDCVGIRRFWSYCKLLQGGGRHVGISCVRKEVIISLLSQVMLGRKSFQFHVRAERKDLEQLTQWVDQGKVKPIVSQVYPLAEIAEAHRQCETRRTVGKIAVRVE